MANLTNLDILKRDLDILVIKILTLTDSQEKSDFLKQKLILANNLEDIIKKHFNNKVFNHMTNEEAADIAVNGYKGK